MENRLLDGSGGDPVAVGAWLGFMRIHLAFQHANLDDRIGPLRPLLGVAEMRRWHHRRDFEAAQVNFGEVLLIWDRLFGTFHDAAPRPGRGDVGVRDVAVPRGDLGQLLWPLRRA